MSRRTRTIPIRVIFWRRPATYRAATVRSGGGVGGWQGGSIFRCPASAGVGDEGYAGPALLLSRIPHERKDFAIDQACAAGKELQFYEESEPGDDRAGGLDQTGRGDRGAAGGEQVIHDENARAGSKGVAMHFQRVGAVLEAYDSR